jgi:hypothetical protein
MHRTGRGPDDVVDRGPSLPPSFQTVLRLAIRPTDDAHRRSPAREENPQQTVNQRLASHFDQGLGHRYAFLSQSRAFARCYDSISHLLSPGMVSPRELSNISAKLHNYFEFGNYFGIYFVFMSFLL